MYADLFLTSKDLSIMADAVIDNMPHEVVAQLVFHRETISPEHAMRLHGPSLGEY
jgi:hypothetical protein